MDHTRPAHDISCSGKQRIQLSSFPARLHAKLKSTSASIIFLPFGYDPCFSGGKFSLSSLFLLPYYSCALLRAYAALQCLLESFICRVA